MSVISVEATVGELVTARPSRSRVFEQLGIDYCCAGKKTLSEACAKKGLETGAVIAMLKAGEAEGSGAAEADYSSMKLHELAEHIVTTHHANLTRELPRLTAMSAKVAKVHGGEDPRLIELAQVYAAFAEEMDTHKMKEERILFPAICRMERGEPGGGCGFGSIANPIGVMEAEHENAGGALARMRELTDEFTAPEWACNTYRALLDGLSELEIDTHRHVHKENYILFPKAIAMEAKLTAGEQN